MHQKQEDSIYETGRKELNRRNDPTREVYRCEDSVVKVFESETHPKSACIQRGATYGTESEETRTGYPEGKRGNADRRKMGAWPSNTRHGKTLEDMMEVRQTATWRNTWRTFVDLQLDGTCARPHRSLKGLKDKLSRQINGLKEIDATTRYELLTRLESMPKHNKVCHGDFNPSNVIVGKNGKMTVVDWAHATQGNASADAAMTYLLFALKDQDDSGPVYEAVLQEERHSKTVRTAVAADRSSGTAHKETTNWRKIS